MEATTLRQNEAAPAVYPDASSGLSTKAAALNPKPIWGRIEAYTAQRFTARSVTWIVEGPGSWTPPLSPATITSAEIFDGSWQAITLTETALGFDLPNVCNFRITASVGAGDVPEVVLEAYRRLAEYLSTEPIAKPGAFEGVDKVGPIEHDEKRDPRWIAKAMQLSGAADLLRPYRRAA